MLNIDLNGGWTCWQLQWLVWKLMKSVLLNLHSAELSLPNSFSKDILQQINYLFVSKWRQAKLSIVCGAKNINRRYMSSAEIGAIIREGLQSNHLSCAVKKIGWHALFCGRAGNWVMTNPASAVVAEVKGLVCRWNSAELNFCDWDTVDFTRWILQSTQYSRQIVWVSSDCPLCRFLPSTGQKKKLTSL